MDATTTSADSSSSSSSQSSPLLKLVQTLSGSIVYTESSNFETNKKLWDNYALEWAPGMDWVQKMIKNLPVESQDVESIQLIGDEWSDRSSLKQVLEEFIFPFLKDIQPPFLIAEIGTGGGRVVSKVISKVIGEFYCFDISKEMLSRAKNAIKDIGLKESADESKFLVGKDLKVHFVLLEKSELPSQLEGKFDFIYSFDVFPHLDIHTQLQYLRSINKSLKIGGRAFISVADLTTPAGWSRFEKQSKYTVGGFYFICPEMVRKMVSQVGLHLIKESSPSVDETNLYYNRDFLFVVQKRG